jgi:hypothetical protein
MEKTAKQQPDTRPLSGEEITQLEKQGCWSINWSSVQVAAEGFDANKIQRSGFHGNVEIGASVTISNVCEISYSDDADCRPIAINVINENGGRAILPCPAMNCGDVFIWAKYRGDNELMARLSEMSLRSNHEYRPKKTIIGDNAVIINTKAIRNSKIDSCAVIDGAEIIGNSVILSDSETKTFVGAAVQIRDSIVGYGSKIDSAAQLDKVMTGIAASISRAARVTHSFVGDCANIACCEVMHCYVAPFHGQQHNNSFLISTFIGGQSNLAAGATIGSNHNSRANDGEIWAKRGFWPGLCVSLKHNSRFASFTMIVKGDYPAELDVKLPFSLLMIDNATDTTMIFPAYWFTHNMYAAMKSEQKFISRDKRGRRGQSVELSILAPDTVEEIFEALRIIESKTPLHMERKRPETIIKNADEACKAYRMMIRHYCAKNIVSYMRDNGIQSFDDLLAAIGPLSNDNENWLNCGGTIITETALTEIIVNIKNGKINKWADVHAQFDKWTSTYKTAKIKHALKSLAKLQGIDANNLNNNHLQTLIDTAANDYETIVALTRSSRQKDFTDPFRTMVYDSPEEMEAVLGSFDDDPVVKATISELNLILSTHHAFRPAD